MWWVCVWFYTSLCLSLFLGLRDRKIAAVSDRCTHGDWVNSPLVQAMLTNRPVWNQPWCANPASLWEVTSYWGLVPEPELQFLVWSGTGWKEALPHFYTCTHTKRVFDCKAVTSHYKCLQPPEPTELFYTEISQAGMFLRITSQDWQNALPSIWCLQWGMIQKGLKLYCRQANYLSCSKY